MEIKDALVPDCGVHHLKFAFLQHHPSVFRPNHLLIGSHPPGGEATPLGGNQGTKTSKGLQGDSACVARTHCVQSGWGGAARSRPSGAPCLCREEIGVTRTSQTAFMCIWQLRLSPTGARWRSGT